MAVKVPAPLKGLGWELPVGPAQGCWKELGWEVAAEYPSWI